MTGKADLGSSPREIHQADAGSTASAWLYVGTLSTLLTLLLPLSLAQGPWVDRIDGPWLFLVLLFAGTEYYDLSVHDGNKRVGLTSCDAILMPLVAGYPFGISVLGVIVAMAVVRTLRWRGGALKWLFNVSSYGLAAAAAAAVWSAFPPSAEGSITGLLGAALAGLTFAAATHVLTSIVISLVEGGTIFDFTRHVAPITMLNVAANIATGTLFVLSFSAASVSVLVFPFPLMGLHIGIRAVARRSFEKDRIEKLYEATHALVASDPTDAFTAFLSATCRATSSEEAILVIERPGGLYQSRANAQGPIVSIEPLPDGHPMRTLFDRTIAEGSLVFSEDDRPQDLPKRAMRNGMLARVAASPPAVLALTGRTSPDEFGDEELKLLLALAHELGLALDSQRLLIEVTEERERLRRIFEGSREGIALLSERGVVVACNAALQVITGLTTDQLTGARWRDVIALKRGAGGLVDLHDILTAGEELEAEILVASGEPRWVAVTAAPVEVGEDLGWVVLVRDITQQRELELAKSDFLATISHELRTPLTSIKGSLQILSRPDVPRSPEAQEQMLGIVRRGADRLERLVLNLLFVSQLDAADGAHLFIGHVDLNAVLAEAASEVLADAETEMSSSDSPITVNGDRERLVHAFEHLFENATTHGRGRVSVKIEVDKEVHVLIADEGPGVPSADRERIFQRFVRLGDVTTRDTQGAGVGLYIARASLRGMGGDVWVEDGADGRGSVFHVRLPLVAPAARRSGSRLAGRVHDARRTEELPRI